MSTHPDLPVGIDPRVDVVFRNLFGAPEHESILLSFLNAVLAPPVPIVRAAALITAVTSGFLDQKAVVVDIEAEDERGHRFHVEMQRQAHRGLDQRILYSWARLYAARLRRGGEYSDLRPVVSVWICDEEVFPEAPASHLQFGVTEVRAGFKLHPDLRIDVLQLGRARAGAPVAAAEAEWFRFFNEAPEWRIAPESIHDPGVQEALAVLDQFHNDAGLRALYQARLHAERMETMRQRQEAEWEQTRAERAAALAQRDGALAQRDGALAEAETARLEAEKAQAEAENQRAEAENQRAEAENQRAEAENQRAAKDAALAELAALRAQLGTR